MFLQLLTYIKQKEKMVFFLGFQLVSKESSDSLLHVLKKGHVTRSGEVWHVSWWKRAQHFSLLLVRIFVFLYVIMLNSDHQNRSMLKYNAFFSKLLLYHTRFKIETRIYFYLNSNTKAYKLWSNWGQKHHIWITVPYINIIGVNRQWLFTWKFHINKIVDSHHNIYSHECMVYCGCFKG